MSLLVAPSLPIGATVLLALLLLRAQRAASADQRRATANGAVLISLCYCAATLVAARWPVSVPAVSATQTLPLAAPARPEGTAQSPADNPASVTRTASIIAASKAADWAVHVAAAARYLRNIPAVGACCVGLWFIGALIWGERLRRSGTKASDRVQQESAYEVRILPGLTVPACLGGLGGRRPVLLLPEDADHWSGETLTAVILHEEAHIAHRDHLWNGVAFLLCTLQWFNPLVWLLLSRLRLESERAADDAVLARGLAPSVYTKALLQFQQVSSFRRAYRVPIVAQPLVRKSGMAIRLEAVLTQNRRGRMTRKQLAVVLLGACFVGVSTSGIALSRAAVRRMIVVSPAAPAAIPSANPTPRRILPATATAARSRKMELVQVGVKDGSGPGVVWNVQGNLVPSAQVIAHRWRPNRVGPEGYVARYRHIVFRVQAEPGDIDPESAVGSPSAAVDYKMPPFTSFGYASSNYLRTKDGWHYFVDHFSVQPYPQGGSKPPVKDWGIYRLPRTSLGVSVTLKAWEDRGSLTSDPAASGYQAERATVLPKGFFLEKRAPIWSKVEFSTPVVPEEGFSKYVVTLHNDKTLPENLVEGSFGGSYSKDRKSFHSIYYVGAAPDAIAEIRHFTRSNMQMDLTDVPLSPRISP
ncbi:MAG: M56 family metallopeptidase [Armatimonadota bacterium]